MMKHSSRRVLALCSLLAALTTLNAAACSGCDGEETPDMSVTPDEGIPYLPDLPGTGIIPDMEDAAPDLPDEEDLADADMRVITPETPEQEALLDVAESERWQLAGLSAPAHVVYTELGRPHVYAANREDMGRVLGFVVARDRFFLMDLQRRLAQGRLSELLGDAALANDVESRLTGMDLVTQRLLDHLTEEDARYIDAYVAGINAYIDAVAAKKAKPPSELVSFKFLLGQRNEAAIMKPFTRRDVAAMVAVIMYETNFETGDVARGAKLARLEQAYADAQTPLRDARRAGAIEDVWQRGISPLFDVHSAAGWSVERGSSGAGALPPPERAAGSQRASIEPRRLNLSLPLLDRTSTKLQRLSDRLGKRELDNFGSNTWAVAGSHTADGAGLVSGDGHLPLDMPALMYQIGLDTMTFGDEDLRQTGLLITSLPILAVGTNGQVAWSQVNPFADIVDWYAEEIELVDGKIDAARFGDASRPLERVEESYVIAEVAALESVGRIEVLTRFETFDGRLIYSIEGEVVAKEAIPADREAFFDGTDYVLPADLDGDGVISAVSFDYTAFDTTQYIHTLEALAKSKNVEEYRQHTKGFIGNMLYSAATDAQGNVLFSSYQAVPCRGYLAREADGTWKRGAHPGMLLDGTTYGGFSIPSNADGTVDESKGSSDPYRCVVPFDETPQAINPDRGFVLNANNQPAPITSDASLEDDPWYIGGPWRAVRADSIEQGLTRVTSDKSASIEAMAEIQADHRSRTGEMFLTAFLDAIGKARTLSETDGPISPEDQPLLTLYLSRRAAFDEVATRLERWQLRGLDTPAGVDTFYHAATEDERDDAVATMIFNAWLPRVMQLTFEDEPLEYYESSSVVQMRTLKRMLDGRDGNSTSLASYDDTTRESAFFDRLGTPELERSEWIILQGLDAALTFLESAPQGPGEGGFGTGDMAQWRWGLRHQARFASILASFFEGTDFASAVDPFSITTSVLPLSEDLMMDDPRFGLKWFPRPGDNFAVDAANPGFSGTSFTHGSGPVMRMVISLKDGKVAGQNIIPGGQSALNDSPHFADQLELWLANETIPLRYTPEEVAAGGVSRALFLP